ncbi:methylmalonyl-CoA mutase family protein [Bacteroidota bacterium]
MEKYKPKNHIRIVTATSLFDGHDVAINIMRRIIQSTGGEVIHLGHNISAKEIVECAIEEDAQAIAVTSYQGGHMEFFKYMFDLLKENNSGHIKIFGGGGGVILPEEIKELHDYGISKIYTPDDGRKLGLQGMISELMMMTDFPTGNEMVNIDDIINNDIPSIAKFISTVENFPATALENLKKINKISADSNTVIFGITGTGGSGKSTLVDELIRRFITEFDNIRIGIISIDPTKRKTGGALLGDRIRMNSISSKQVYMRSMATRKINQSISENLNDCCNILKAAGYDLIFIETSGIGQSGTEIVDYSDVYMYVMTPEFGAETQLEKIDMLDFADIVAVNKFDKRGADDSLRAVKKQFQRNHSLWEEDTENMPVYGSIASQFNNTGVNILYEALKKTINKKTGKNYSLNYNFSESALGCDHIIPGNKVRYLSEISETVRNYNKDAEEQALIADKLHGINQTITGLGKVTKDINQLQKETEKQLSDSNKKILDNWEEKKNRYSEDYYKFKVRDNEFSIETKIETLSHLKLSKVSLPKYKGWGDILKWNLKENVPGEFPFAAGVFPFKRENEDPTRMFAGEGGPERTNKRFHYLSQGQKTKRLSTAYDSVTLYGADPDIRPDIYGKIGNSGVSVSCLDDSKKLYSGIDLVNPLSSVSMTINGPGPIMVGYFMNTAIDQQCEKYIRKHGLEAEVNKKINSIFKKKGIERPVYQGKLPKGNDGLGLMLLGITGDQVLPIDVYEKIKKETISVVRGTVQADILKEDQAQNTCIFSIDFSLKIMGDVQEYFVNNNVRNFYSVSISGYHIAEAGANPITQLAFTLSNGFTFVEYYLARGMDINSFAPNLSFFFSNGLDPEYTVIGRVARLIWAKAMKYKYNANSRSQKLKYHIQTSGRSLHAQEIEFNDIRTTLQALGAVYDNCNSLHTNAYDEAITTPTEESVRRALAIQMIINNEYGLAKNQNPLQGSFIIEELTDLVEEAVLSEFDRLTDRGGVLGAMETMYQRSKIQEESMYYENLKLTGKLPIMGVNTFLSSDGSPTILPNEVIRSTDKEKKYQVLMLGRLHKLNEHISDNLIKELKEAAIKGENVFEKLLEITKYCSIGQISNALYDVGGQYRRNM